MNIRYILNEEKDSYCVASVESYDKTIFIPKEYEGKPVTSISEDAFQEAISIEEVCLPDTINLVNTNAFNSCFKLVTTFTYGQTFNLDNLIVNRGNANLLMSNIIPFGGEQLTNKVLDDWYHSKEPLLLESTEIFNFDSIHYLRVAIEKWAYEQGLKAYWIYCDKLHIDEDTTPYISPKNCDFIVLDSVEQEVDEEYLRYIRNVIYRSTIDEKPVIGLVNKTKDNHDAAIKLFQNHEILFDKRLEILNNNLSLKVALDLLSNSKRVSVSTLQREMSISYPKAKKMFDTLVNLNLIQQVNNKYIVKIDF